MGWLVTLSYLLKSGRSWIWSVGTWVMLVLSCSLLAHGWNFRLYFLFWATGVRSQLCVSVGDGCAMHEDYCSSDGSVMGHVEGVVGE